VWRERISALTEHAKYAVPVANADLISAEVVLGPLPAQLGDLLAETDGVWGAYDLDLIWPLARIVRDNVMFRTNPDFASVYMPFDALLFFADAGNGDQFAFPCLPRRDDVFVWDHESDSRSWVAGSLDQYLQWWLDGTLKI
jgi:SUKH superfamily protein